MIYPILHKLFGWDYIHWENSCDYDIARVHKSVDGTVWYWQYKTTRCMKMIPSHHKITWLTCKPEKYLGKNKK